MQQTNRYIEIEFGKEKGKAILLDDVAPETCNKVWNSLPIESFANHVKIAGDEIMFRVPVIIPGVDVKIQNELNIFNQIKTFDNIIPLTQTQALIINNQSSQGVFLRGYDNNYLTKLKKIWFYWSRIFHFWKTWRKADSRMTAKCIRWRFEVPIGCSCYFKFKSKKNPSPNDG